MSTTCLHSHISIYSQLMMIFNVSNYMYHLKLTLCMNYRAKTGNNVSKFMHSIMLSYYSIPKHKSLILKYLIHFSHFCTQ